MKNELIPFNINSRQQERYDIFQFSLGNLGLQTRIEAGLVEDCLSVFVTPMTLSPYSTEQHPDWHIHYEHTQELILPVTTTEPLLQYAKLPFDHIQWGRGYVKLFWQREVLQVSCKKVPDTYELTFKKLHWDGETYNWRDGTRKTLPLSSNEYDYSLNLSTALTRDKYLNYVEQLKLEDKLTMEEYVKAQEKKKKVNKVLGYIGLQLKEERGV